MKVYQISRTILSLSLLQFAVLSAHADDVKMKTTEAQVEVAKEQSTQVTVQQAAPVVISEPQIVTQPTTVVEDSPLVKSRAEQLRSTRQGAEIETEQKIVEKLEESRLQDEQRRLDNLFKNQQEEKVAAPTPTPQQVDTAALKAEVTESVKSDLKKIADEEKAKEEQVEAPRFTVGAGLGFIGYSAANIRSDFAGGASFGYEFKKRMELEFGYMYSKHLTQDSFYTFQKFDQHNVSAGIRYGVLPFAVRPVVGASMSYTRRNYTVPYAFNNNGDVSTNAIDFGLIIGADVDLGKNLVVSVEYRYYMNAQNNIENNDVLNLRNNPRLEDGDYDVTTVGLRLLF